MTSLQNVTLAEFQKALDEGQLRMLQILQGAIGLGVMLFLGVVFYLSVLQPTLVDPGLANDNVGLIQVMTFVHIVMAIGASYAAGLVFNMQFTDKNLEESVSRTFRDSRGGEVTDHPSKCVYLIRNAMVTRLAILEAPSLFGLVVCLLASFNGVIHQEPIYWINALSAVGLVLFVGKTFPGRASVEALFQEKFAATGAMS